MDKSFRGRVSSFGQPVLGAKIRLVGDVATLGGDPRAVADNLAAVTWTRAITGYSGSIWNAWQRYVARDVAGLAWEEFRVEVVKVNPSLRLTDEIFQADMVYSMPENRTFADTRSAEPTVLWDRRLTGFSGSRWECWRSHVQGKVIGLSWPLFEAQVTAQNPQLAGSDGEFLAELSYLLPRNVGQDKLVRVEYGGPNGKFLFEDLPSGTYQIEIVADGYQRLVREIVILDDKPVEFELNPISIVIDKAGDPFVGVSGRHFHIGGRSFRFIGVNLRGLVHYETPILDTANARQQLTAARDIGAKVIRVFLPHRDISVADIKSRFRSTIDLINREYPEMVLIVALTNFYGDVGFNVPSDWGFGPGNKGFYTLRSGDKDLLGLDWFRDGYKQHYLPFVKDILETFKQEPRIMAWNIGNELKAEGDPGLLVAFMHDVASKMRTWDPNHLITTGMISTRHAWMAIPGNEHWRMKLYDVPWLHFVTNHAYHGDDDPNTNLDQENLAESRENDHDVADRLGKPLLIQEAGFVGLGNRRSLYEREMNTLLGDGRKAAGYMPWGFMAGHDNRDGDNELGIDQHKHNTDWKDLTSLLRDWAHRLAGESTDLDIPTSNPVAGQRMFAAAGLNLRPTPSTAQASLYKMPQRGPVAITGAMVQSEQLRWWPVSLVTNDGRALTGWMAQTDKNGNPTLSSV